MCFLISMEKQLLQDLSEQPIFRAIGTTVVQLVQLVHSWYSVGTHSWYSWYRLVELVHSWCTVGTQLVHLWYTVGAQLVHSWCTVGTQLVHSWYTVGTKIATVAKDYNSGVDQFFMSWESPPSRVFAFMRLGQLCGRSHLINSFLIFCTVWQRYI